MKEREKKRKKKRNVIKFIILGSILLFLIVFKLVVVFQSNEQETSYEESSYEVKNGEVTSEELNLSAIDSISEVFTDEITSLLIMFISIAVLLSAVGTFILPLFRRVGGLG